MHSVAPRTLFECVERRGRVGVSGTGVEKGAFGVGFAGGTFSVVGLARWTADAADSVDSVGESVSKAFTTSVARLKRPRLAGATGVGRSFLKGCGEGEDEEDEDGKNMMHDGHGAFAGGHVRETGGGYWRLLKCSVG